MLTPWKKSYDQPRQHIFPVVIYRRESWTIKMAECWTDTFWTVVLEKTFASLLDCKEIKSVNSKGNQSWIFVGRTDAEVEAPIFWPPNWKSWLIIKYPDAGKDWRQQEKGTMEDEILDGITHPLDMSLSKLWEMVKDREGYCASVLGVTKNWTWLRLNINNHLW